MYKDKDKQREAQRNWVRQKRAEQGSTKQHPARKATAPLPCVIPERTVQGNIRVSKPGDEDYEPQCETTRAFIEGRDKRPGTAKRGKDIKVFADLPPDVQTSINRMSTNRDGTMNQTTKANRTAIAVNYQHLFPDRYEPSSFTQFKKVTSS